MVNQIKLMVILSLVFPLPVWSSDSASDGISAFRAGEYVKAEQLYRQAIAEESDDSKKAAIYRNLALLYSVQKDGSEFEKKADELNPPSKPRVVKTDGFSELIINSPPSHVVQQGSQVPSAPVGQSQNSNPNQTTNAAGVQSTPVRPPMLNSIYGSSTFDSTSLRGGFQISPFRGATINGGYDQRSGYSTLPGDFSSGSNMSSSSRTPNGYTEYSNSSLMVLPTPNGRPVILNAPGPNIYSEQTAPDGSTTTIIKRTY